LNYTKSIKAKLVSIILFVTLLTSGGGYGLFLSWYMNNQHQKAIELSNTVGLILGQDIAKLLLLNDVSAASDITSKLKSFGNLNTMVLYKLDKSAIFQYSKENLSFKAKFSKDTLENKFVVNNNHLIMYVDAFYQGTHLGYIEFDFQVESLFEIIQKDSLMLFLMFLIIISLSYFLAQYFAKKFTTPISKLVQFLEKVELGHTITERVVSNEENEYGKLYREINTMLERIEKESEKLKIAAVAFEIQNGMVLTDKYQRILEVNKAFSTITGYSKEDVMGETPAILKSGYHDGAFYNDMYNAIKTNHFWSGEIRNKHKNGNIVNEHLIIQAVLDENDMVKYYVASFIDITKQKITEAKLSQNEELLITQSKMAQMGEMLENIAHQWRQPLSVITTSASALQVQHEFGILSNELLLGSLDNIVRSATHLSTTIDDFRDFYKNKKTPEKFHLTRLIESSLILLNAKLKNQDIEIISEVEDKVLIGYENEIIQVCINIINNARDELVMKENQERIIFIQSFIGEKEVKLSFFDNAGGIPESVLPKVFENHFTTKENRDGTGIGLYMSKLIIEKAKGELIASNEHFQCKNQTFFGARFDIILPLEIVL